MSESTRERLLEMVAENCGHCAVSIEAIRFCPAFNCTFHDARPYAEGVLNEDVKAEVMNKLWKFYKKKFYKSATDGLADWYIKKLEGGFRNEDM